MREKPSLTDQSHKQNTELRSAFETTLHHPHLEDYPNDVRKAPTRKILEGLSQDHLKSKGVFILT